MPRGLRQQLLFRLINYWPPYFGAGVRVKKVDLENLSIDVEMNLHFWNKNYVGTQFGGSLYAMCDPFFMLIVMEALGSEYIVWDKRAAIRFKKPGRGKVSARFRVEPKTIDEIRDRLKTEYKVEPEFTVAVTSEDGEVVAEIDKVLHIRRKDAKRPESAS